SVVVVSMHVGAVVVVVEPCSPIVVVVVDSHVGGTVDVEPCSPRVVVVSMHVGVVVVVGAAVAVVLDGSVVVVQSEIKSTVVCSVSVTPSDHDECTVNVIVPVVPNGTVVVANVVSPSSIGVLYPVTGYEVPLMVAVALSMSLGRCTTLT